MRFAAAAMRAFDRYSWPAEVRGADIATEAAGGVSGRPARRALPVRPAERTAAARAARTRVDRRPGTEIGEAGLMPLSALERLPEACFGALPSLHRPPRMTTAIADANQRLSAQLNALLCVSRFAHCVKLMGRDMVGSFHRRRPRSSAGCSAGSTSFVSGIGSGGSEVTATLPAARGAGRGAARSRAGPASTAAPSTCSRITSWTRSAPPSAS